MKHCRLISLAVVMAFMTAPATLLSYADDYVKQSPVYQEFDENEVNGAVVLNVPEDSVADVLITFDSPEVTDEPYYRANLNGGASYAFDIEGRDNSEADYRNYKLSVEITGGDYKITSSAFTDELTVPDVNDNPDSYIEYVYNFTVDDKESENDWDIVSQNITTKNIAVHLNGITLGDIDGNGVVDASDASKVLGEYSRLSTGAEALFSSRQSIQADVNRDGVINSKDASRILLYYSVNSTGGNASWD
ncbi:MAG: dockerin type I domain-containing protein [Ruminococcus flavefaciens]|nr:dockerin type I domain-containing protein [Ruminococcus flavefaciens]MCM1229349.1 dockerin type I domain-containing protein [Ruminococcus flavefaciens]